ncbi:transposase [Streptomyces hygroscopicus]|nr:transposase [Streptomyces hygroscopicus]
MSPHRWDFISENRAAFGVKRICRVLGVSRSGCYRHQATASARAARQAEQAAAVAEIRQIHADHHGAYGAPRIHAELRSRGRKEVHFPVDTPALRRTPLAGQEDQPQACRPADAHQPHRRPSSAPQ